MDTKISPKILPLQNLPWMHQIFHQYLMKIPWLFFAVKIVSFSVYIMGFYTTERCTYRIEYTDSKSLTYDCNS